MSKTLDIPIWKTAPFIRLLPPLIGGILLQWYGQFDLLIAVIGLGCFVAALLAFSFLPLSQKFRLQFLQGFLLQLILLAFGMCITWSRDKRHFDGWYGNHYKEGGFIIATIKEPLVEKNKSFKADAYVEQLVHHDTVVAANGKLLLYFSKGSVAPDLAYGDQILINKKLIAIKNSGNPGAFDYERYAAFQGIFHNVFLKPPDWVKLTTKDVNPFQQFLYKARANVLAALQQNINNGKDELAIAEALLIGYTNDLDKDLVQAYSNTGVVHIIAISGMHLALIYGLLLWIFAKMPGIKNSKILQAILILSCLWLFSLLTGGAASVIRSAVMFSFITVGKMFFKQASIYSSLAASAFVMLCFNPCYLWDVGFQLSYLAVIGIVVFQKPVYNLLYFKNKWLDNAWKAIALTTAAQILTFPVCIYYFHQFPLLFLITNLIAVPLSSIILYAAIGLVAFSWIPPVSLYAGKITGWLLWLMNKFIEWMNGLPFAVWDKIPATVLTTWLLYAAVIFSAAWLLQKRSKLLLWSLASLVCFLSVHAVIGWRVKSQQKIIVYNVPQQQAIDMVQGNQYYFIGDSILLQDGLLQNFHLKPGRIALQLNKRMDAMPALFRQGSFCQFGDKKILLIDKPLSFVSAAPVNVDMVIVSKNPKLSIPQLARVFNCSQYVFDASNSLWKIEKWKQDCNKLHLRFHSIPEQGAFITSL